ncbi:hypothetical protein KBC89_00215 [Candidatus Woesebacteria bacterium]|nr:hypothetical protein [Candidatus Woesebacteria bacterium]
MNNNNQSTDTNMRERIAKLEERVDGGLGYINKELVEIKENHLYHLQADVTDLKMKVNTLAVKVSVGVAIATILIDLVFRFLLK